MINVLLKQLRAAGAALPVSPCGKLPFGLREAASGEGKWRLNCRGDHSEPGIASPEAGERFPTPESVRQTLGETFPGRENGSLNANGCFPAPESVRRKLGSVFPPRKVFARIWVVLFPAGNWFAGFSKWI